MKSKILLVCIGLSIATPLFAIEKLSPKIREVSTSKIDTSYSWASLLPYLKGKTVLTGAYSDNLPVVVGIEDNRVLAGSGQRVYVKKASKNKGLNYSVVRALDEIFDPETKSLLGYQAVQKGGVRFESQHEGISTFLVTSVEREIELGDKLIEGGFEFPSTLTPKIVTKPTTGRVVSVFGGVKNIGRGDVVVIHQRLLEPLESGSVMKIYSRPSIKGEAASDDTLGEVLIVKSFGVLHLGLITVSHKAMSLSNYVGNLD